MYTINITFIRNINENIIIKRISKLLIHKIKNDINQYVMLINQYAIFNGFLLLFYIVPMKIPLSWMKRSR